jgi:hypothetical protein
VRRTKGDECDLLRHILPPTRSRSGAVTPLLEWNPLGARFYRKHLGEVLGCVRTLSNKRDLQ